MTEEAARTRSCAAPPPDRPSRRRLTEARGTTINTITAPRAKHLEIDEPGHRPGSEQRIRDHLRLVRVIALDVHRRVPGHVQRDDLISAGNLALVQAAEAFDPARGVPFDRYAARRIRGALVDELRTYDWASRNVRRTERAINEAFTRLAALTGQTPNDEALADETGLSVAEILANRDDVRQAAVNYMDAPTSPGHCMAEDLRSEADDGPERALLRRELMMVLTEAIRGLPERHRRVIEDHYFLDRPMIETAQDLGVTDSRISQIRAEAVGMLRDAIHVTLDGQGNGDDNDQIPLSISSGQTRKGLVQWRRRMAYAEEIAASYRATSPLLPRRGA